MKETFGETLKRLRLDAGLTLEQLAAKARVSYMTIHLIEKGKVKPRPLTAHKIAKALDHSINMEKTDITME